MFKQSTGEKSKSASVARKLSPDDEDDIDDDEDLDVPPNNVADEEEDAAAVENEDSPSGVPVGVGVGGEDGDCDVLADNIAAAVEADGAAEAADLARRVVSTLTIVLHTDPSGRAPGAARST